MSVITDTWHELVRRRLWPVALLLAAALAAVPVMLAKDPEPVSVPALPGAQKSAPTVADSEPIVAMASAEEARRRRVLGARKDPFEPAPLARRAATPAPTTVPGVQPPVTDTGSAGLGSGTGGFTPPSFGTPVAPPLGSAPSPPETKPSYPLYTLTLRFGDSATTPLETSRVTRLEALPSADEPVLVYLGVEEGGRVAVFMVDSAIEAQGDGVCKPEPLSCQTIHLREGDTEFFDVLGDNGQVTAQYQLDLVDIKRKQTSSAAQARRSYAKASKAGRKVVRAAQSARGPLRYSYDVRKGVVKRLGKKSFKAATARSALAMSGAFDVER